MKLAFLPILVAAALAEDGDLVARGEKLFAANCAVGYCHGSVGAAARGPRLKDRKFSADELYRVTRDGIPRTAMPGWKDRLTDDEIRSVVAYVLSLSGIRYQAPVAGGAEKSAPRPAAAAADAQCAACHSSAIAGELAGRKDPPTVLKRVRTVKLKDGETFPALVAAEEGGFVRVYDLTDSPPVKRSLERAEIESVAENSAWRHPPTERAH